LIHVVAVKCGGVLLNVPLNAVVSANRRPWPEAPPELRRAIHDLFESPVVSHHTQWGGFSEGIASRLRCADGRHAFVKAIDADANEFARNLYEREARLAPRLPACLPVPRCHGVVRESGWIAMVFDDAGGPAVSLPWDRSRLNQVSDQLARMSRLATPSPVADLEPWGGDLGTWSHWQRMREDPAAAPVLPSAWQGRLDDLAALEAGLGDARRGETLLHGDLRSDNIVIRPDGSVMFVDWAQASVGAAWIDPLILALCAAVQGVEDPDGILAAHPEGRRAPAHQVNTVLAAMAGRFVSVSATPGPAAIRAFQRAESDVTLRWLSRRLDGSGTRVTGP
jgi:aminoglycoside phosphotransferase